MLPLRRKFPILPGGRRSTASPLLIIVAIQLSSAALAQGPLGAEFQINTFTTNNQGSPAIATLPSGAFVAVWDSDGGQDGNNLGIFAQRYSSAGAAAGSEFQVNSYTTGRERDPDVASNGDGSFVVVWNGQGLISSSPDTVRGQRFTSSGASLGAEFVVATHTGEDVAYPFLSPRVASSAGGGFVVVWQMPGPGKDGNDVFGRLFSSSGVPVGPNFQINTYTTGNQARPAVATGPSGNFFVVWMDGVKLDAYGQHYDSSGRPSGGEFQINAAPLGIYPNLTSDGAGNFVVVWQSPPETLGKRYDSSGLGLGDEFVVGPGAGFFTLPAVAADSIGNFVVVWRTEDSGGFGVTGRRFNSSGTALGSEFLVNSYTTGSQVGPDVSSFASSEVVVVWQSSGGGQDGDGDGVFGQRFGPIKPALFTDGFESGDTSAWPASKTRQTVE